MALLAFLLSLFGCSSWHRVSVPIPPTQQGTARAVFGGSGDLGGKYSAVAVVEIDSQKEESDAQVSGFEFLDKDGRSIRMTILEVEKFNRPASSELASGYAYYLNRGALTPPDDRSRPWDGRLPAGKIRLRVRGSVNSRSLSSTAWKEATKFRLTVGTHVVVGDLEVEWAS